MALPTNEEEISYALSEETNVVFDQTIEETTSVDNTNDEATFVDESSTEVIPQAEFTLSDVVPDSSDEPSEEGELPDNPSDVDPVEIPVPTYSTITVKTRAYIFDYSSENLQRLQNDGGKFYAIYEDDTEDLVSINEVSEPDLSSTAVLAFDAAQIGAATNQHFWDDTQGIHVTGDSQESWTSEYAKESHGELSNPTDLKPWHNILINSLGLLLRRGLLNLAALSKGAIYFYDGQGNLSSNIMSSFSLNRVQIGKDTEKHIVLDTNGLTAYNADGSIAPITGIFDGANISNSSINASSIDTSTFTNGSIAGSVIDASKFTNGQISGSAIEASTLTDIPFAEIDELKARNITAADIASATGYIDDLSAGNIDAADIVADHATVADLETDNVTVKNRLSAAEGNITTLNAEKATVASLNAATARIGQLETGKADVSVLESDYITADAIEATYTKTDFSNADVAWIQNGTIKDGSISNAMINTLSANKIVGGTADFSKIEVANLKAEDIEVTRINGQVVSGKNLTDALAQHETDISDLDDKIDTQVEALNDRIDGAIETFTGTVVPTLNNTPASNWNTTTLRDQHIGDVYYVVNSNSQQNGYCYRFTKSGSTYSWQLIKDSDVTAALSRLQTAEGKITTFDSDISQLKTDTGTLTTKTQSLETSLGDKVDVTTFNEVSDTVDGHSQSITQMSNTLSTKADSSIVSAVTQRVSKNEQDISGINTTIGSLETSVASKADGSALTTVSNKLNTVSDTVDGHTQQISSVQSTLATKANSSTVTALDTKVNNIKNTVDGHTSSLQHVTEVQTQLRNDIDNIEVGGRNLLLGTSSEASMSSSKAVAQIYEFATVVHDMESGTPIVMSFDAKSTQTQWIDLYPRSAESGGTAYADTTEGLFPSLHIVEPDTWYHCEYKGTIGPNAANYAWLSLRSNSTEHGSSTKLGTVSIRNMKLETGTLATDWSPAPEDIDASIAAVPRMGKINAPQKSGTTENWKTWGAFGYAGTWTTGSDYDNSHLRIGDTAYVTGVVTDGANGSATIIGVVTAVNGTNGTTSIGLRSTQLIFGGDALANVNASLTATQSDYAEYKQTTEEFKSAVGSTYATKKELGDFSGGHPDCWRIDRYSLNSRVNGNTVVPLPSDYFEANFIETLYREESKMGVNLNAGDYYLGKFTTYVHTTAETSITDIFQHDDAAAFYLNDELIGQAGATTSINVTFTLRVGWNKIRFLLNERYGADYARFATRISTWENVDKQVGDLDEYEAVIRESRITNAETSIEQNKADITLRAKSSDVYTKQQSDGLISTEVANRNAAIQAASDAINLSVSETYTTKEESGQQNLHPIFSYKPYPTEARNVTSGYWQYWTTYAIGSIIPLEDGWAHCEHNNDTTSTHRVEFGVEASEFVKPATDYTILVEVQNIVISGGRSTFYLVQQNNNQFWGNTVKTVLEDDSEGGNYTTFNITDALNGQTGPFIKRYVKTSEAEDSAYFTAIDSFADAYGLFRYNLSVPANVSVSFDARISIYEGEYWGPYKPYIGSLLYTSQSQLESTKAAIKITTDGISSEVSKKTDKDSIISTIIQSPESIKISANRVDIENAAIFTSGALKKVMLTSQTQWYSSTSATTATGGSWGTAQPSVAAGRYIWERTYVTYSDGTSAYLPSNAGVCIQGQTDLSAYSTTIQANAAYDAKGSAESVQDNLDKLKIGGRNLLPETKTLGRFYVSGDSTKALISDGVLTLVGQSNGWPAGYTPAIPFEHVDGSDITLSFEYKADAQSTIYVNPDRVPNSDVGAARYRYAKVIKTLDAASEWTRYFIIYENMSDAYTGIISTEGDAPYLRFSFYNRTDNSNFRMRFPKLEIGNKATDWTEAPEDTAEAIESAINGIGGFDILWNRAFFDSDKNAGGECYLCAYDPTTATRTNVDGWAMWNGTKRTITKGMFNPNTVIPYNIPVYIVCRLSSSSDTTGINYMVWYDSGWKYAGMAPSSVDGTWTWSETTDMVLGKFVEPAGEAAFTECETYRQPLKWGTITTDTVTARSANAAAEAAQATANNAAPKANAVKRTQRIYYRKSALGAPSTPSTWVGDPSDSATSVFNAWTTKVPRLTQNADGTGTKYLYLYTCEQHEMANGTLAYTTVLLDDSTTVIDGGNIITGSVAANSIDASSGTFSTANIPALTANHIKANVIEAVNNGTGTINADKINASALTIGYSQITNPPTIPSNVSQLTNDSSFATTTQVNTAESNANSYADDAVDGLVIGGTNLLGNTANLGMSTIGSNSAAVESTFGTVARYNTPIAAYSFEDYDGYSNAVVETSTTTGNNGVSWYTKVGVVKADTDYTFSCRVWSSVAVNIHTHTAWRKDSADSWYIGWTSAGAKQIIANEWTDYSFTFKPASNANLNYEFMVAVCFTGNANGITFKVAHAQLEEGVKATSWSKAPEDHDVAIADAAKTATNYIAATTNGIRIASANPSSQYQRMELTSSDLLMYSSDSIQRVKVNSSNGVIVGNPNKGRVTVTDAGITIHDTNNRKRTEVNNNGLEVFDSTDSESIASFGSTARIGKANGPRVLVDSDSVDVWNDSTHKVLSMLSNQDNMGTIEFVGGKGTISVLDSFLEVNATGTASDGGVIRLNASGGTNVSYLDLSTGDDGLTFARLTVAEDNVENELWLDATQMIVEKSIYASDGEGGISGTSDNVYLCDIGGVIFRFNKNTGAIQWYDGSDWIHTSYRSTVDRTANRVLAAPNGSDGPATFRALVAADLPTVTRAKGGTGVTGRQYAVLTPSNGSCSKAVCWHNGVVATVVYNDFSLSSALASGSSITIGSVITDFQPPENIYGVAAANNNAGNGKIMVKIDTGGTITLWNRTGASLGTNVNIYFHLTYAI